MTGTRETAETPGEAPRAPEGGEAPPPAGTRVSTMGWLSFFTMFVIGTDTFLVAPLLPLLQRELDVPLSRTGWLVSAYALGYALFALVAGPVSDRHDRRRVILSGLAAFAVLTCACGLAWSFWSMVAARFLAGVSAAFVSSQIWASIPMTVPRPSIIRVMGYATAGLAVAQVAGVPIGSYLSVRGWQLPFFIVAAAGVILWGLLCAAFPHVRPAGDPPDVVGSYRRVFGSRVLSWSLLAYLVFQAGNYVSFSFIGSWLAKDFGASQTAIGKAMMVIGLGTALGSLLGPRLVARIGERRSLWAGIITQGAFYLLAATMPVIVPTMWGAVAAFTAALVVAGFLLPILMGQLQAHAGQARGTVSSLSNTAMYLGATIAGAIGGGLLSRVPGFWGPGAVTAAAFLLAIAVYGIAGALASE
ncbi:MFS transporter [Actinomyces sp. ZJ308]|uniref:MFS transporter n=1 Tax=Actinomyces sp. ZJ308 TaxID=2708342 RepID=UPI00141F8DC1|nr:MFS transporter [Actinomyces sp. ZJ308]